MKIWRLVQFRWMHSNIYPQAARRVGPSLMLLLPACCDGRINKMIECLSSLVDPNRRFKNEFILFADCKIMHRLGLKIFLNDFYFRCPALDWFHYLIIRSL